MSPQILYRWEEHVRGKCLVFLVGAGAAWFGIIGYGLLVRGDPLTLTSTAGTCFFAIVGLACVTFAFIGGTDCMEISDEAICWKRPIGKPRAIAFQDIKCYEIVNPG